MQGIYRIRNLTDGRYYIGRSQDIDYRWKIHKQALANKNHCNQHLQAAWDKDGEENFAFEIIEEVPEHLLLQREQAWLNNAFANDNPYNILEQADGSDMPQKSRGGLCSKPKRVGRKPQSPKPRPRHFSWARLNEPLRTILLSSHNNNEYTVIFEHQYLDSSMPLLKRAYHFADSVAIPNTIVHVRRKAGQWYVSKTMPTMACRPRTTKTHRKEVT